MEGAHTVVPVAHTCLLLVVNILIWLSNSHTSSSFCRLVIDPAEDVPSADCAQ